MARRVRRLVFLVLLAALAAVWRDRMLAANERLLARIPSK